MTHCKRFDNRSYPVYNMLLILVGFILERNKICSKYNINQGIDGFKTCQQSTLDQSFYFFNFVLIWA